MWAQCNDPINFCHSQYSIKPLSRSGDYLRVRVFTSITYSEELVALTFESLARTPEDWKTLPILVARRRASSMATLIGCDKRPRLAAVHLLHVHHQESTRFCCSQG